VKRIREKKVAFGGGCHWCTEAVFQAINGVILVEQGFVSSYGKDENFSEAVIVHYDPTITELSTLIKIHLRTHNSSSNHKMREKYRFAIYTFSQHEQSEALNILENFKRIAPEIITRVLPFRIFQPSAEEFCNYYRKDPKRPFCKTYIDPKFDILKKNFGEELKKGEGFSI